MATLSLTVVPGKALKDGRHKVRIAVAHNSQTRYIITDVTLDSIKEWRNGMVVKRGDATYLNTKLRSRVHDVQKAIDELPYAEGLSCAELVESISNAKAKKMQTLRSSFEEMMEVSTAKASSISVYRQCFKSITKVIPETTLVANLTPYMIQRFAKSMGKNLAPVTVKNNIALLSMIIRFCQVNGYTDYRVSPTAGLCNNVVSVRQNWLTPDEIRKVRDFESKSKSLNRWRDIFMLSYYLGGINIVDLAKIDFGACKTTIKYIRTKTERRAKVNPYVEFNIPDEAQAIISKLIGDDGRLHLYKTSENKQSNCISKAVRCFRDEIGIPALTYYSARKSFAQHAFALGESESVIDYILGHALGGNKSTLYSYIKVTPEMATACVRKVCDFIASSDNLY